MDLILCRSAGLKRSENAAAGKKRKDEPFHADVTLRFSLTDVFGIAVRIAMTAMYLNKIAATGLRSWPETNGETIGTIDF